MAFPTKAKIIALVCTGLTLPKLVYSSPKLNTGKASCNAITTPPRIPTTPQTKVARINSLTILLS